VSWTDETTAALVDTFVGTVDHPLSIAAVAIDGHDESIVVTPGEHLDGLFEIGSITKTMTATLLAILANDDVVTLDAPIGTWLDAGDNRSVTLEQLATHTSGLPRVAPNSDGWPGFDQDNPYRGYDEVLAEDGARAATRTDMGSVAYSNFGYQLLGVCLERAAGSPLGWLFDNTIFEPLAMITATASLDATPVPGFSGGELTAPWRVLLGGPGGVDAAAADMAAYMRGLLRPPAGALGAAIDLTMAARAPRDGGDWKGLGWTRHQRGFHWHNGGTGGFRTMLAVDRDAGRAALAMLNSADIDPDRAVALAITGDDPRSARPEPVGDEWADPALAMVRALVDRDYERACSDMTAATAEVLTVDRMREAWEGSVGELGDVRSVTLRSVARAGGAVQADIDAAFANGQIVVETFVDDARRIVGVRLR
jgi:CubicO group peptidase (beta-lactamase class C family)